MTQDQITKLNAYQEFRKSILDNLMRDMDKIPEQYGTPCFEAKGEALNDCNNVLLNMRDELINTVKKAQIVIDNLIEKL